MNSLIPLWIFLAVLFGAPLVDQVFTRASEARTQIAFNTEPNSEASYDEGSPSLYQQEEDGDESSQSDSAQPDQSQTGLQGNSEDGAPETAPDPPVLPEEPDVSQPPSIEDLSLVGQERTLTQTELDSVPVGDISLLRNAFYARVGYKFSSAKPHPSGGTVGQYYTRYFSQFDWYAPSISDQKTAFSRFTPSARQNVEHLASLEGL